MYTVTSYCQVLIHLLLKHPILTIAMGLVGTSIFITPLVKTPTGYNTEWNVVSKQEFVERIEKIDGDPAYAKKMEEAERWFQAILATGKGDPGMTKVTLKDLERSMNQGEMGKYPDCPIGIDKILQSDNETKIPYARLYFYDRVRSYQNPEVAVLAYKYGPKHNSIIEENYKTGKLPQKQNAYLQNVKNALKGIESPVTQ